ncbi:MAG TPA: aldo/keto reductase [Solirubrobacteraceae bacterium]|nr:aldo/keto reductase [Solirubrobacteraceae bacterium]
MQRTLGSTGITVSALGFGCWAIGGPFGRGGSSSGWGKVDDDESIAAIRRGLERGVTFYDTADVYGTGHSETVLGRALGADRDAVAIATKFGNTFDEGTGVARAQDVSSAYIREACAASLRRLGTDRIDLYQCHVGDLERSVAEEVAETLEELCDEGLIRAYGWSTDDVQRAGWWAGRERCATVQHHLNVLEDAPDMLALCEREGIASINRGPLAMGLLSGKFSADSRLGRDDVRGSGAAWLTAFDAEGRPQPEFLDRLAAIRDVLTSDGRTLVQGALAWIWGRSERTVPIPGFRTVVQADENAGALAHGPLPDDRMAEIDELLGRTSAGSA